MNVKDPICGMTVDTAKATFKATKAGKTEYFCSKNCLDTFNTSGVQSKSRIIEYSLSVLLVAVAGLMYYLGYMLQFMGVVFLILAGLKLMNVKGFATMFQQYDVIASRSKTYAYAYPFIELYLGISYILNWNVLIAAIVTVIVMGIGAVGVTKSVFGDKKIACACLGSKIKVPLTTFTIVEDVLMAVMGLMVLFL